MKKRLFALLAAGVILLSACGEKKEDTGAVVATIGDHEVTESEFNFLLENVKEQLKGTELSSDEDWETKEINGKKAIEAAKEQALESARMNFAYIEVYKKLGNKIGDAEKEEIKKMKDNIVSQYDKNGGYEEFLKTSGITDSFVDMMCEAMFCSDKLFSDFSADRGEVSEDELETFYNEHYNEYFAGYRRAKHVLILTQDAETHEPFAEDKKAEAKEKAEGIYERAKAGEDFDALVSEYSEDPGSAQNPDGYTFSDGEMVQEFQDCVDSLAPGEIGFCESSFGYHIIKRYEVDKAYFADRIKQAILSGEFNDYIKEKADEYGITVEETPELDKAGGKGKDK